MIKFLIRPAFLGAALIMRRSLEGGAYSNLSVNSAPFIGEQALNRGNKVMQSSSKKTGK